MHETSGTARRYDKSWGRIKNSLHSFLLSEVALHYLEKVILECRRERLQESLTHLVLPVGDVRETSFHNIRVVF